MNIFLIATILIVTLSFPLKWNFKFIIPGVAIVFILWVWIELINIPEDRDAIFHYSLLFKAIAASFISFLIMLFISFIKAKIYKSQDNCLD